jgi:hypothetical protein
MGEARFDSKSKLVVNLDFTGFDARRDCETETSADQGFRPIIGIWRLYHFHSLFLLTTGTCNCYEGTKAITKSSAMTDHSQIARLAGPIISRTVRSLSAQKRSLVALMREHQFGRVENMPIRAGQPVLDGNVRVVRVARLGAERHLAQVSSTDEFELKKAVCDLLDELERLQNDMVVLLEFRHGLPFLLETTPRCARSQEG